MKRYIHYGHDRFIPEHFTPIRNRQYFSKPFGGLWASPVDAEYGWKDWCEAENFRECREDNSFTFTLAPVARVLYVAGRSDLKGLPRTGDMESILGGMYDVDNPYSLVSLDFERLRNDGWDAVEVTDINRLYWALYGWDCDSILVMNPDIIEVVE